MRRRIATVLAAAIAGLCALAPSGHEALARDAEPTAVEGIRKPIEELAWLAGDWKGTLFGGDAEERWSAPWGGVIVGTFRLSRDGRTGICEFMILEQEKDGTVSFRFKHYGRGWNEWEQDEPLTFTLVSLADAEAVFEATREQNVRRMTYRVEGDALTVEVDAVRDGEPQPFTAEYTRVRG